MSVALAILTVFASNLLIIFVQQLVGQATGYEAYFVLPTSVAAIALTMAWDSQRVRWKEYDTFLPYGSKTLAFLCSLLWMPVLAFYIYDRHKIATGSGKLRDPASASAGGGKLVRRFMLAPLWLLPYMALAFAYFAHPSWVTAALNDQMSMTVLGWLSILEGVGFLLMLRERTTAGVIKLTGAFVAPVFAWLLLAPIASEHYHKSSAFITQVKNALADVKEPLPEGWSYDRALSHGGNRQDLTFVHLPDRASVTVSREPCFISRQLYEVERGSTDAYALDQGTVTVGKQLFTYEIHPADHGYFEASYLSRSHNIISIRAFVPDRNIKLSDIEPLLQHITDLKN